MTFLFYVLCFNPNCTLNLNNLFSTFVGSWTAAPGLSLTAGSAGSGTSSWWGASPSRPWCRRPSGRSSDQESVSSYLRLETPKSNINYILNFPPKSQKQGAAVAVLRGAVLYGLDPAIVHVRRATKTYGIGIIKPFNWKLHPRGQ